MRGHKQQGRKLTLVVIMAFLLAALMPLLLYVPGDAEAQDTYMFPLEGDDWYDESLWDADGLWHLDTTNDVWRYADETNNNYVVRKDGASVRNYGSLVSKEPISLVGHQFAYLSFNYLLDLDTSVSPLGTENAVVFISTDGSDWSEVARVFHSRNHWLHKNIDITQFAGNNIYVRFFFDTVDGQGNNNRGWFLDNVRIFEQGGLAFYEEVSPVISDVSDLSPGSIIAGNRTGYIFFRSDEGKARGPELAPIGPDYIAHPGEEITIRVFPYNPRDEISPSVAVRLTIANRFGRIVHSETEVISLDGRLAFPMEFEWTPAMSDHYIVFASIWNYISESPPAIDPFTFMETDQIKARDIKVFDTILDDDCTPVNGNTETDDWEAVDGQPLRGRWVTQTNRHFSPSHAWNGGTTLLTAQGGTQPQYWHHIVSEEIDAADLYWVYRTEAFNYPEILTGSGDVRNKMDLQLSFFYMYFSNELLLDNPNLWGGLQIRRATDGETWSSWQTIWDGIDQRFDPEEKLYWPGTGDSDEAVELGYVYEIPTTVNLIPYLPTTYSPDFKFQMRFSVPTLQGLSTRVWYIDDIQLFGIKNIDFDLNLGQSSTDPVIDFYEQPKEDSVIFDISTPGSNFASRAKLSVSQVDGPAEVSFSDSERWFTSFSTNDFTIVGGAEVSTSLTFTTNTTPEVGVYTFLLSAEAKYSEWPDDGGVVATAEMPFKVWVGANNFTISSESYVSGATRGFVKVPDILPNPGETLECSFWLKTTFPEDTIISLAHSDVADGWDVEFPGGSMLNIPRGHQRTSVDVYVTAPEVAEPGESMSLNITASTDDYSTTSHDFAVRMPAVLLTPDRRYQIVGPGDTAEFTLIAEAMLGKTTNFRVDLEKTDIIFDQDDITIEPDWFFSTGSQRTITVTIDVPGNLPRGVFNVTILGEIDGEEPAVLTLLLMHGDPDLRVAAHGDTTKTAQYSAGQFAPLFFEFYVYNDGDAWADVEFSFSGSAASWVESTIPSVISSLRRDEGGSLVEVRIVVDSLAVAGSYSLTVLAEDSEDISRDETTFTVNVPSRYVLDMMFPIDQSSSISALPGEKETISLLLSNNGNAHDTVSLSHGLSSSEATKWGVGFENQEGSRITSATVAPFSTSTVNFVFNASTEVEPITHTISLKATSIGGAEKTLGLTVDIEEAFGLTATGISTWTSFDPRDDTRASFSFHIKNTGNTLLSVGFSSIITIDQARVRDGWLIAYESGGSSAQILDLEGGETKRIDVHVTPPGAALAGDYEIEVGASFLDLEESITMDLEIVAVHDIVISSFSHPRLSLRTGERRDNELLIENSGNTVEDVKITIRPREGDGDEGWLTYSSQFTLRPGESSDLGSISILIPEGTYSGEYTFVITVSSTNTDPQTETFTLVIDGVERGIIFGLSMTDLLIIAIVLAVVIMMVVAASRSKSAKAAGASEPEEAPVESVEDAEEEQPEPASDMQIQI